MMTTEAFQKKVIKANWYDKYWFIFIYLAAIVVGVILTYCSISRQYYFIGLLTFTFFMFIGIRGLFLVRNRYKVQTIASFISINSKKKVILQLSKEANYFGLSSENTLFQLSYRKSFLASEYHIFLALNPECFYISVQSRTGGAYGGGIIDLGGTERMRRKVVTDLNNIIADKS